MVGLVTESWVKRGLVNYKGGKKVYRHQKREETKAGNHKETETFALKGLKNRTSKKRLIKKKKKNDV